MFSNHSVWEGNAKKSKPLSRTCNSQVVDAWLGLVQMVLLALTLRNCPVSAGTTGAHGWLCICPWHESWHSGDWAVAGSDTCSSGVWPLHSPAPHGFSIGPLAQILHHSLGWLSLCLWGFLLGWLGETRDTNKVRMNWRYSDFFVPPCPLASTSSLLPAGFATTY